jgi:hypothetical protein
VSIGVHSWLKQNPENYMRELLILLLIAAVGYLAYDDYYKQRPALEQAQQQIQQLTAASSQSRQNPARMRTWTPVNPTPPAWFQKRLDEGAAALEMSRQHTRQGEQQATPHP